METKKISIDTLTKVMSPKELQNVLGGSDPGGGGGGACLLANCLVNGGNEPEDCSYGTCTCDDLYDQCEAKGGHPMGCGGTYC